MKKLIVIAIIGVGGWFAYAKVLRPAPKRACAHLHALCNDSNSDDDKSCTDFFDALKTTGGESNDKTAQCVLEATTCPEAIGCTAGGAVKLGTGFAKNFLDGFQKSVH